MTSSLYRKHRPLQFADLIGQRHIRITLEQALLSGRVTHAYLFTGPRGIGKTTTARILARAVNCLNRGNQSPEPCNQCENCRLILENRTLDVMEVDAASQTGVDNVRENIIQSARALPSGLRKKVFIIDEVHMLSLSAFNALLKLLEEPPAHAMFILATTDVHRIPETVISRTQRFDFHRIALADIEERLALLAKLEERIVERAVLQKIARAASGSLRDAEGLLGQLFGFPEKEVTAERLDMILPRSDHASVLNLLQELIPGRGREALEVFHAFVDQGGDIVTFTRDLLRLARIALLVTVDERAISQAAEFEDEATVSRLSEMAKASEPSRMVAILEEFAEALRRIPSATIESLPVELSIIRLCHTPGTSAYNGLGSTANPAVKAPAQTSPGETRTPARPRSKSQKQKGLDLVEVTKAWEKLQSNVGISPGLALSLKQSRVVDVEGTRVSIAVPFALHADRLRTPTNSTIIHNALQDALGSLTIEYIVRPPDDQPKATNTGRSGPVLQALQAETATAENSRDPWDELISSF